LVAKKIKIDKKIQITSIFKSSVFTFQVRCMCLHYYSPLAIFWSKSINFTTKHQVS